MMLYAIFRNRRKKALKNKKYYTGSILWLFYAVLIFVFDRAVKLDILAKHRVGAVFGEIPFVADFVYVQNTGAAFSMFSNGTAMLSVVSIVFCIAVLVYWIIKKPQHRLYKTALMLMFSGALGNAADRILYGFVVDFISIKWFDFPVFNIADMAIVIGAVLLVVYVMFFEGKKDE